MNSHALRIAVAAAGLAIALASSAATTSFDPYVPGDDKDRIAADLSIPVADILVDRRCVYTRTDAWVAATTIHSMSTCTVLATPTRLVLANYDKDRQAWVVDLDFDYAQIRNVALSEKEGADPDLEVDGRKLQVQFETDQGFISVTAWRSPPKVKPFDPRGAEDLFALMKAKGVAVVEPKGLVEVKMSTPGTFFRRK